MGNASGTMVIRAWRENATDRIRARLISSGPGPDQETVELADDAPAVLRSVQQWLESLPAQQEDRSYTDQ